MNTEQEEADKQQSVIYLTLLVVLQILIAIFLLLSNQNSLLMLCILGVILLIAAHCLKSAAYAAYFTLFALMTALYVFGPVGLWITGHGQTRTRIQNGFAMMAFIGLIVAVVLGYLYKRNLQRELQQDFMGDASPAAYNPNNQTDNKYLYRAGQNANGANGTNGAQQGQKFQQFAGQGYSLG